MIAIPGKQWMMQVKWERSSMRHIVRRNVGIVCDEEQPQILPRFARQDDKRKRRMTSEKGPRLITGDDYS